ncbi:WD40 repeat domain-containing protein [Gloeobacter kilaueensis]|uniref:WD40 repeat-containing protein n=1 Tax=Gloeobacter kilaueensis (strain ATCC BAA-2537 / CCAP 1431/1 / ULC 316 / JS1) TaxID=1183438 RepID=U5QJ37_GLOK1|nr:WD40 repeat domain-containing protein [Gloeobacter kilaueensis]AGY58992.1 WD40 repeat-containing protein [Gloeobacter kilaueensis JS1]
MEKRLISAVLSEQTVTYRPGGPPVTFEVTVSNDSEQFAGFKLELLAAGSGRNPNWYQLHPEVSTAKPPGGRTQFQITIVDTPIAGFVGAVNVTVLITSPQLKEERKYLLRLIIEPGSGPSQLSIELPVRQFQTYPRNPVDIPVRVRNMSQRPFDMVLRFVGIDSTWMSMGTERRFIIEAGSQLDSTFQCLPPGPSQAPSQEYPFSVEGVPQAGPPARAEGSLEVLPVGFVQFNCSEPQQRLPAKGGAWWPDWSEESANFALVFKNASNLRQEVTVDLQGRDTSRCGHQLTPDPGVLNLATTTELKLAILKKRPLFGLPWTYRFETVAVLADDRLGNADPPAQKLTLRILPKLPLWLQLLMFGFFFVSGSFGAISLYQYFNPPYHTDLVNSVRISSDARLVFSASDDRTIRSWSIEPGSGSLKYEGVLVDTGKPVRALRFMPRNNSELAAGLENGAVQIWNVATGEKSRELIYQPELNDRVFDLAFTANSRYLFSGHGSGIVVMWDLLSDDTRPRHVFELDKKLDYTVQALELSGDERTLISAGRFLRLVLWNLDAPDSRPRRLQPRGGQNDVIWSVALASQNPNILATADSQGNITTYDLTQCSDVASPKKAPFKGAVALGSRVQADSKDPTQAVAIDSGAKVASNVPIDITCPVIDQWVAHGGFAVRSLAFSDDGRFLVSGGDDHKVVLWNITAKGGRDARFIAGRTVEERAKKINTVDLSRDRQGLITVSGGDDFQVQMRRVGLP